MVLLPLSKNCLKRVFGRIEYIIRILRPNLKIWFTFVTLLRPLLRVFLLIINHISTKSIFGFTLTPSNGGVISIWKHNILMLVWVTFNFKNCLFSCLKQRMENAHCWAGVRQAYKTSLILLACTEAIPLCRIK